MAWRGSLLSQSKHTTALKATWQQLCCDMGDLTENRDSADVTDAWRLCSPGSQNPDGRNPGASENPPTLSGTSESVYLRAAKLS